MASGDTLLFVTPASYEPWAAGWPVLRLRSGHPVLAYNDTANWAALWTSILPRVYAGGGLTITLMWVAATATTGAVRWQVFLESIADENQDIDSSTTAIKIVNASPPGVNGNVLYTPLVYLHSEMMGLVVGGLYRLWVFRLGPDAADTMVGDAQLLGVEVRET